MARLLPFAFVLALAGVLPAQTPAASEALRAKIAELAGDLISERGSPGVVVGIVAGGEQQVFAFGKPDRDSEALLDGDSLFEIGSITKVFTCLALAHLVGDGSVRLEDPLQGLLPATVIVPRTEQHEIRLLDLATHHSGLPRLPRNLHSRSALNPYADYTVEDMYAFLGDHDLQREVGESYEYSNFAMGLLGHALALHTKTDYEALLRQRICEPLGMHDTSIALSADQRARLAHGHARGGRPTPSWDIPALAGAGALRSSTNDMLRFAAACLEPPDEAFAAALALTMEPHRELQPHSHVGLGWHIAGEGEARRWWHNGATGGYASYLAFNPARGTAVVVLSNRQLGGAAPSPIQLGNAVLDVVEPR